MRRTPSSTIAAFALGVLAPGCVEPVAVTSDSGPALCSPELAAPANGSVDRITGSVGDVATYACDPGFAVVGDDSRTCEASGRWSGAPPRCTAMTGACASSPCANGGACTNEGASYRCDCSGTGHSGATCRTPIVCSGAVAPTHGAVSATSALYPEIVTYACDPGYELDGSDFSQCTADGSFAPGPPVCLALPCAEVLAPPVYGSVDRTSGSTGDVATYSCDVGYMLTGSATRVCDPSGAWSPAAPLCVPATCTDVLPDPAHGSVDRRTGLPGEIATYSCDAGYSLSGAASRTCGVDGSWSGAAPTCDPRPCVGTLTAPVNGSVNRTTGVTGDVATYSCDAGYALSAGATRTCQVTGAWSGSAPTCVPATCVTPLVPPLHGLVDRTTGVTGDVATYSCDAGYALTGAATRTCAASGSWSGSPPSCDPRPCAGTLAAPANGAVDRTTGVTGDVATYSCSAGYMLVGTATRTCDGTAWSGSAPVCRSSACGGLSWCWESPLPQGNTLNGVWGSSATDVWAVGELGTILRWNGTRWSAVASGVSVTLRGIWGSSASDVWVVGDAGTILHWTGSAWTASASGVSVTLRGIWGSSASDVWAVGENGTIRHWDGTGWSASTSSTTRTLTAVYGVSSTAVWAVSNASGISNVFLRWNGLAWASTASTVNLNAVWGSSATDVWAVGDGMAFRHWTGASWVSVFGAGTSDLWGVWGTSATDAWAVGRNGSIQRWNGTAWLAATSSSTQNLNAVWGSSPSDVWAVGAYGTIVHFDGTAWSEADPNHDQLFDVWASSTADVWAVGAAGAILHGSAGTWTRVSSGVTTDLQGVSGTSASDVWAVGSRILHWDGGSWSMVASGTTAFLYDVWAIAANDAWAVGTGGAVVHWDGVAWTVVPSGTTTALYGVWGIAANDVWAVGQPGLTIRWNGAGWSAVFTGSTSQLRAVSGTASDDVWAVGTGGTILHWNGGNWGATAAGTGTFSAVWATSRTDAWAVGDSVMHWTGTSWIASPTGTSTGFDGVAAISASDVWAVGGGGTILRYQP